MTDDQKTRVKEYISVLNSNIDPGMLLDLVLDTVVDRVLLYLNETTIAPNLERVIAQVVVNAYQKAVADRTATSSDQDISSVTDNGQTVSFRDSAKRYMATSSDQELFTGFTALLNSYRRPQTIKTRCRYEVTS